MNQRKSQRQAILQVLLAAHGGDVPSVELSKISLQYGARVKELRERGFRITNRTERRGGRVFGYFRLEKGFPGAPSSPEMLRNAKVPALSGDHVGACSLFGEPCRESEYPD